MTEILSPANVRRVAHGQPIYENPSPGNRAGGITTLEEKSLGAVQKGGHTQVTQVLQYGERARRPGLALLESPGNDAISSTALVAAGATVLLFTTGRGTPPPARSRRWHRYPATPTAQVPADERVLRTATLA